MASKEKTVTWWQVNNIIPIIASAVAISLTFLNLKTEVALLNQRMVLLIEEVQKQNKSFAAIHDDTVDLTFRVQELEIRAGVVR